MCNHFFIGMFLVGLQLACFNCAHGHTFLFGDPSMDLPSEEKHTADNLNIVEDAKVEMAKRVTECKDERDCSWIEKELAKYGGNLDDYCKLYKDRPSIKQCSKTCKICKAPAPIECKDERDCSWIEKELAKYGGNLDDYCKLYKDRPSIKQCSKTCKMCKAPAPIECKDERDCSWIETELAKYGGNLDDYCKLYKDSPSIKQCRKTCKMCKAPSPSACQNEREDCDLLIQKTGGGSKLENYCKKWKNETSVKQCPETCNMCPKNPSTPSRDLAMAAAVADKRLAEAARYSRAHFLHKLKNLLAARRRSPREFSRKRAFSRLPLMESSKLTRNA